MAKKKSKKRNPKTISQMTGTRGVLPPPTSAVDVKKKKNDRNEVKRKLRKGDYDY